jgi:hypothetical protein
MEHLQLAPPGWTLEQLLLVVAVVFLEWNILAWLRAKVK